MGTIKIAILCQDGAVSIGYNPINENNNDQAHLIMALRKLTKDLEEKYQQTIDKKISGGQNG